MSKYETKIGKVVNSEFVVGDNANIAAWLARSDRDDMTAILSELHRIASKYDGPVADELKGLTLAASQEVVSGTPERTVFRRLADATRRLTDWLGPSVVEAGALADAAAKINDMIRHM